MRDSIAKAMFWLANRISAKSVATKPGEIGSGFVDAYRKYRLPSSLDLLNELKNTAWTCVSINASVCAANPPKLYVRTTKGQDKPKCQTKAVRHDHPLLSQQKSETIIEEVTDHPLLTLLDSVNPVHNSFDLWELTQFYQEIFGTAYWKLEKGLFDLPNQIWVLPSQNVTPRRLQNSNQIADWYEYRTAGEIQKFSPEEIIQFRLPDPRDPYSAGMSPLKGCYEQVSLSSQYNAMRRSIYDNTGIPSVVISPKEQMGEDERQRLEDGWNNKFRRGGNGRALVASETELKVDILSHSMGDLAALAEAKATKEDVANAFHVPIPYLTGDTNLANMEAAEIFHTRLAITPRLRRRDQKINEQLIPIYDTTGRLFVASEDPTPTNKKHVLQQHEQDIRLGIRTINEVRVERGFHPVPWGDKPYPMPQSGRPLASSEIATDTE